MNVIYCTWNNTKKGNGCNRKDKFCRTCTPVINGVQSQVTSGYYGNIQVYYCHCNCTPKPKATLPNKVAADAFAAFYELLKDIYNIKSYGCYSFNTRFVDDEKSPCHDLTKHYADVIMGLLKAFDEKLAEYKDLEGDRRVIRKEIENQRNALMIMTKAAKDTLLGWTPPESDKIN